MEYYLLSRSHNLKITGFDPQSKPKQGFNPTLPDSFWQVHPFEFPDFQPKLDLEMHRRAMPTNYLHYGGGLTVGILVDKKLKELLELFHLPPHRFYKIRVYQNNKLLDYYWFHYIIDDFWDYVDLEKSSLKVFPFNPEVEKTRKEAIPIMIESFNKVQNLKEEFKKSHHIEFYNIAFKTKMPYDIFCKHFEPP